MRRKPEGRHTGKLPPQVDASHEEYAPTTQEVKDELKAEETIARELDYWQRQLNGYQEKKSGWATLADEELFRLSPDDVNARLDDLERLANENIKDPVTKERILQSIDAVKKEVYKQYIPYVGGLVEEYGHARVNGNERQVRYVRDEIDEGLLMLRHAISKQDDKDAPMAQLIHSGRSRRGVAIAQYGSLIEPSGRVFAEQELHAIEAVLNEYEQEPLAYEFRRLHRDFNESTERVFSDLAFQYHSVDKEKLGKALSAKSRESSDEIQGSFEKLERTVRDLDNCTLKMQHEGVRSRYVQQLQDVQRRLEDLRSVRRIFFDAIGIHARLVEINTASNVRGTLRDINKEIYEMQKSYQALSVEWDTRRTVEIFFVILELQALYREACAAHGVSVEDSKDKFDLAQYYEVLGIQEDADAATIKQQYRQLTLVWHPDRIRSTGAQWDEAHKRMKDIIKAFDALKKAGRTK